MLQQAMITVDSIESVVVCCHPECSVFAVFCTHHTSVADNIATSVFIADISEIGLSEGLHEYTFLQQSHPHVARIVFYQRIDLAMTKVYLIAEKSTRHRIVILRIIDIHSVAIGA